MPVFLRSGIRLFAAFMLIAGCCNYASAASFIYTDFSSVTGLNLVTNAAQNGSELRLTPNAIGMVGAAWYSTEVDVDQGFQTSFQFRVSNFSFSGADGFAFVIQADSGTAIGAGGSGLGYETIVNSVAVEFDTFLSDTHADPDSNHIAVITKGTLANSANHQDALGVALSQNLPSFSSDGQVHTASIIYVPPTLKVHIDGHFEPVLTVTIDLAATLNLDSDTQAYVGFTAATGGDSEEHAILNWSFNSLPLACTYSDDFEDGSLSTDWTYVKDLWTESDGAMTGTPTGKKAVAVMNPPVAYCQMCSHQAVFNMANSPFSKVWMLGWYVDKKNTIEIIAAPDKGKWLIKQRSNGVIVAKAKALIPIAPLVDYDVKVDYDGSKLYLYVDNQLIPVATMNVVGNLPSGGTGFQVKNTTANFKSYCMTLNFF